MRIKSGAIDKHVRKKHNILLQGPQNYLINTYILLLLFAIDAVNKI